ncbi:MAG: hypothetical protein Q8K32_16140 [Archangium sp.]|nr:hypothetical protein [Archangium sp.]
MRLTANTSSAARREPPRASRLKIATYNVLFKTSDAQTKEDLSRLMRRNGVINLQEFNAGHRDLFTWIGNQGWGHVSAKGWAEEPIIWDRRKYQKVDSGQHRINDAVDGIAGRKTYPAHNATWVRLKDRKTGKVFTTVSVHTIAHNRGPKLTPLVDRVSKHQFSELAKLTERLSKHGPVIIGGDLNTSPSRGTWPRKILEAAHLRSNWQQLGRKGLGPGGTHGPSFIDHFLTQTTMKDKLKLLSHDIVRGGHSDHNAVEADYRLK